MKTRVLVLILLFSLTISGFLCQSRAQEVSASRDSLLSRLETLGHDTLRLRTLYELSIITLTDTAECMGYVNDLLQEAESQQNNYYKVQSYIQKIILAYNSYDAKATEDLYNKVAPIARKEKLYNDLFLARRCVIDMQLLAQNYERCEKEGLQMLDEALSLDSKIGILEAYQTLSNLYRLTYRREQAVELLEKARPMAIKYGRSGTIHNIYQTLATLYIELNDDRNWFRTLTLWEDYSLQKNDHPHLTMYAFFLKYYTEKADWKQAEKYWTLGEKVASNISSPLYKIHYMYSCYEYFIAGKEYNTALKELQEITSLIKTISKGTDYYNSLLIQAGLLRRMGRYDEAIPLFKEVFNFKDELRVSTINKQYEQLKKDFNADQLLFEQAQLRQRMQLFMLGLLLIGLFAIGFFLIHLLRSRRFLQKAEREMREMTDQMELANQAKDRFLSNINNSISEPLNNVLEGSLRLAERQVEDENERQLLSADIRRKATDLLRMINDILDLSRLEAGMMKFETTDVEITSTLLDAIGASPAIQRGLEIEPAFAMDTLYMTRMDGNRLLQVFKSLFLDKASGSARIEITTSELNAHLLEIVISGSIQAQPIPAQDIIIHNEINRMLILSFNGSYEISDTEEVPTIRIQLPLSEIIRPE